MNVALVLTVVVVVAVVLYVLWTTAGRMWVRYRGDRVVTCPETGRPAAVAVDVPHAMASALQGHADVRLEACSRWPERAGCGQECLNQIEESPLDCMVRTILTKWYADKPCVLCGKPFGEIHWHDHKPCLMDAEGATREWSEFQTENLAEVLGAHRPVCWNCHVAERFRRDHGDLVVNR